MIYSIDYQTCQTCQTCPTPHLSPIVFECSVCEKEGCGDSIKICGFISDGPGSVKCDKFICFDCGYSCMEDCGLVRCSLEHADKCQECGCSGMVRCGQCRRKIENDKGSICIDCINGFHPGKCMEDGDEYEYEWIEETDEVHAHWGITPKKSKEETRDDVETVNEKARITLCEEKKQDHEANGFWYTWVEKPDDGSDPRWHCVLLSEYKEKEKEKPPGFWSRVDFTEEFDYEACDD